MVQRLVLVVFLGLAVTIASLRWLAPRYVEPQPAHLGRVATAQFTDQSGAPFNIPENLLGRITVLNLFYSGCHGPCPALMQELHALERARAHDSQLQFVSLSIDGDADTPETLTAYAREQGLPVGNRWHLLTGPQADVAGFAEQTLHLGVEPGEKIHSTSVVVIDGRGEIRGSFSAMDSTGSARLQATIDTLSASSD